MAVQLTAENATVACDVVSLDILDAVGKMNRPHITDGKPVLVSDSNLKQRVAAILDADVTGYSRLMAANERETVGAVSRRSWYIRQCYVNFVFIQTPYVNRAASVFIHVLNHVGA